MHNHKYTFYNTYTILHTIHTHTGNWKTHAQSSSFGKQRGKSKTHINTLHYRKTKIKKRKNNKKKRTLKRGIGKKIIISTLLITSSVIFPLVQCCRAGSVAIKPKDLSLDPRPLPHSWVFFFPYFCWWCFFFQKNKTALQSSSASQPARAKARAIAFALLCLAIIIHPAACSSFFLV